MQDVPRIDEILDLDVKIRAELANARPPPKRKQLTDQRLRRKLDLDDGYISKLLLLERTQ